MYVSINMWSVELSVCTAKCPSRIESNLLRVCEPRNERRSEWEGKEEKTPDRQVGPNDEWTSRRAIIYNRRPVDIFSHTHTHTRGKDSWEGTLTAVAAAALFHPSFYTPRPRYYSMDAIVSSQRGQNNKRIDGQRTFFFLLLLSFFLLK